MIFATRLANSGLYGTTAYAVTQRRREIGIRMALGATRGAVLRLVLRQSVRALALGSAFGVAGALLVSQALRSSLFGIRGIDWSSYAVASLLLGTAALLACWLSARRATRVNPSEALRSE